MTTSAVLCNGLHKRYGPHQALRGLDLEVPKGSLFGFLGPNGAGKSTTLRILSGLVRANAGSASIFGVPITDHVEATRNTAFLIENAVFPRHLTAEQVLRRTAALMGTEYDESLLERVDLAHARKRRTGGYSHGMKQRLGLACTLLGKPDLLVLDEPQNGLDPVGLRTIRRILREEHERGATILVSVHRLAEVEGLCTHAALVVEGKIVRQGTIAHLLGEDRPRFRVRTDDPARAAEALEEFKPQLVNGSVEVEGDDERAAAAAAACQAAGLRVFELAPVRRTLDELYLEEVEA
ncbi:MAG: ABC transporter ATP-binding protein [Planctomycetota bacterium]|jgi:ABC-2 type transport system ATP-binding protein